MYEIYEKLLEEFGVSTADVSRATGIGKSTFSAWKSGEYVPKQDKRQKIADYFGVTLDYLDGKSKRRTLVGYEKKEFAQKFQDFLTKTYGTDSLSRIDEDYWEIMHRFESELLYGDDPTEDDDESYYSESEVAQIAKKLYERQDLRVLFDATKDLSKEDIAFVTRMLEGLKKNDE